MVLNSRLRFVPRFVKLCFEGGKRGNQALCGWIVWVAESLDENSEPRWQRFIECSLLIETRDVRDTELVDSFVVEMGGLCGVVFALASLIAYGCVAFSARCFVVRDFNCFPGFACERLELSPATNISLLLRRSEQFVSQSLETEDGERRSKRIRLHQFKSVFGGEKPFVQTYNSDFSDTRARTFVRLE